MQTQNPGASPKPTPYLKVGLEEDFSTNDVDEGGWGGAIVVWVGKIQSDQVAETGQLVESSSYMF